MLTFLVLASTGLAGTLTVDPDDSSAYATIQDAIDDASSDDTIEIAAGTYEECVGLDGKDLTITGADRESTFVDCIASSFGSARRSQAFELGSGETGTISGLTISSTSRGIYAEGATLTLDDVTIEDSGYTGWSGGAIAQSEGSLTISNSTFSDNSANAGAHIAVYGDATLDLDNVVLDGGSAAYGGAIYTDAESSSAYPTLTIVDSTLSDNYSHNHGGAILLGEYGVLSSSGNTYSENGQNYTYGGAIYADEYAQVWSAGDSFESNGPGGASWGYYGGAIYLNKYAELTVDSSSFEDNFAYNGGAIYAAGDNQVSI
ncbi:MAG: hypothetical protein QGG40_14125, partial [Myxococcota bacterium]|nr:hypothetical protein [Myxococcota bacterium]